MNTIDNSSYYRRTGSVKQGFIEEFVREHSNINDVYDIGCNNGDMSYPLQTKLGKRVYGVDLSIGLIIPSDYNFRHLDIVESNEVFMNDCTLFLSLYHHILSWHGLGVADDLFYKLLLRTKYLIFDTGNVSEKKRRKYKWLPDQEKLFSSEIELLDHFGLPYEVIGKWSIGGGSRSVVVFHNSSFGNAAEIMDIYYRLYGSKNQHIGLVTDRDIKDVWEHTVFNKLRVGNKFYFTKKHLDGMYTYPNGKELMLVGYERDMQELYNISLVYKEIDKDKLIKFYGYSERYGLIYEWLDDFIYIGKDRGFTVGDKRFKEVDVIEVNGVEKFIDFLR